MNTKSDSNIYRIRNEGNQIEIDYLGKEEYRLICRDHYSENFVDYYVDEGTLRRLADFINEFLGEK